MSDYDALWRSLLESDDTTRAGPGEKAQPGSHSASAVRIIDAAILVVRAVRNLAGVTEEVLIEQRNRVDRVRRTPPPDSGPPAAGERIDLSY